MKGLKGAEVARNRKIPPKLVEWAQERILQRLIQILSAGGLFTHSSTGVSTTTRAVAVNDVRNGEIINSINAHTEVLEKIHSQLVLLTGSNFKPGEKL